MSQTNEPHDVFLCFPYDASGLGKVVLMGLEEAGLRVFRPWAADVAPGARAPDPRTVLAGSSAVVGVVLSGDAVDPTLVTAIGAARGLGKPVYIVTDDVERPDLPPYVASLNVFSLSRLDPMCEAIKQLRHERRDRGQRRVG